MLINGELVDDGLVRIEAAQVKGRLRLEGTETDEFALELRAREVARELVIERTLLRQAALKDTTAIPPIAIETEVQKYYAQNPQDAGCLLPRDQETLRANIETELRIQRFLTTLTAHVAKPTGKQVTAFYQYVKQSLTLPETIHAAHIVKNVDESTSESEALTAMQHIQSLLQQGVPFEKVADECSDCPGRGGDLGVISRGEMVEEFEAAVFPLPVGLVSEMFRTPFGFHIAKVYEREAERIPTLNEVRSELEASIRKQAMHEVVLGHMTALRAQAEVRKSK
jgi:parvulin-like peptidyl-prolyl isomerase